jgi:hypothetical protein
MLREKITKNELFIFYCRFYFLDNILNDKYQGLQCGVFGVLFTLHLTQYTKFNDGVKKTVGVNSV